MQERARQWAGTIVLARPVPLRMAGWISALLFAALVAFLWRGEYTKTIHVSGAFVGADEAWSGTSQPAAASPGVAARLLVPSQSIGFIENGQTVLLRIAAFPHQKFGLIRATVERIDPQPVYAAGNEKSLSTGEAMYAVIAVPERQTIHANGKDRLFLKGMSLDADIQQERRRLVEWFMKP